MIASKILYFDMKVKKLCELKRYQSGIILNVDGDVHLRRRLLELGLTNGTVVKILSISPLKNSFLIALRNYTLALRKNSLNLVSVAVDE